MPGYIKSNNQKENFYARQPLDAQLNMFVLVGVIAVYFFIKEYM
jgi:hypothetical protein